MHTILIVEDDSTIHMMMHEYLEKRGFRCEDAFPAPKRFCISDRHAPTSS